MLLNDKQTLEQKKAALQALPKATRENPTQVVSGLFFAARNGAISHLLRVLEMFFRERGMDVAAAWNETSMGKPFIALTLRDRRTGEHTRRLWLDRSTQGMMSELSSMLVYALDSVETGAYYGTRKPKIADDFDAALATPAFEAMARKLVNGANYPFAYESHSSF